MTHRIAREGEGQPARLEARRVLHGRGAWRLADLLAASTHDPETNYRWSHEMPADIAGSVLLTRDGDGHATS